MIIVNNYRSKVNRTLKKLADICTENTDVLKKLADQAEDFAVQLIDQVNAKEELVIREAPKNVDHYASLLTGMTDEAIILKQKKVSNFVVCLFVCLFDKLVRLLLLFCLLVSLFGKLIRLLLLLLLLFLRYNIYHHKNCDSNLNNKVLIHRQTLPREIITWPLEEKLVN